MVLGNGSKDLAQTRQICSYGPEPLFLKMNFVLKPRGGAKPHFFLAATRGTGHQIWRWKIEAHHHEDLLVKFHRSQTSSWVSNFNSRAEISEKRDFLKNGS